MFVRNEKTKYPMKIWLEGQEQLEESCLEQAENLANLPFIHKWVCLMPDTHTGKGMPIGGVIATKGVIIPNAVGADIGCGMNFVATNVKKEQIAEIQTGNGTIVQSVIGNWMRNIPVGVKRYKKPQESSVLDQAKQELDRYEPNLPLLPLIEDGYYQVGTLGGGNHFVELQEDENGYLCIMLHSGSRHMGKEICDYFHQTARELNNKYYSQVPENHRLCFLPVDTKEGQQYIHWMKLALDYAFENRSRMMKIACQGFREIVEKFAGIEVAFSGEVNCHHNYASLENHYDANVWVHRKGATRVRQGEVAVIPGAMGSYSYVVEGKGNPESFCSSSHGAGRAYSRTGAREAFTVEQVIVDLKEQGVVLGKSSKKDVAEECRFAYKDIDEVMMNQTDLVTPIRKLKTVAVLKG